MVITVGEPLTPAQDKVLRVAVDISEAGRNIGFGELPSVIIHELYEAVQELKRERKMPERDLRHIENDSRQAPAPVDNLSTEERARRFKFAIAEYARFHREWLRQSTDLDAAQKNVARLAHELELAREHVLLLIGNTEYLDFMEALHWRYVEHG